MKKKLFGALLCVALAAGSGFAMTKEEEGEAWKKEPAYGKTIKVGYNGGLCLGSFGIAQMQGFYEAEGLKVEVVRMSNGTMDAVSTGKVDVAGDHIATLLVPTVNGLRMKFTTGVHTGCKSLYVGANSPFKTTKDLIGQTIGIHDGIGQSDQNIAMRFFNNDGIDPVKQVKWQNTETGISVMAIQKGELGASLLSDQFAQKFVEQGQIRPIRSLTFDDDFKVEPCCIHAINLDFYNANPITSKKLTRAHNAARAWITAHQDEAVKVLQEGKWAPGDPAAVTKFLKTLSYEVTDERTEQTLRTVLADYKSFGMLPKNLDIDATMKRIWDPILLHD